jgi:DNA-binding response OmpR family regulator
MSEHQYHVLIVDDEPIQIKLIERYLREHRIQVASVPDGREMDRYLAEHSDPPVDLLIMDLNMPWEDGLSITRRLRMAGNPIPIIMLSSFGDDVDRIVGLEVGVDDYLKKPPNPRELLARVRAVMRRQAPRHASAVADRSGVSEVGPFALDRRQRRVTQNGEPLELTDAEFNLFRVFLEHAEQELSRDFLMEKLKGYEHTPFDRSIDVCVRRLRTKIESDPSEPRHIRTLWGKGYMFVADPGS